MYMYMWGIFISISAKFGFLFCFVWQGCFPHPGRKGLRDRSKSGWSNFHLDSEQHVAIFAGEVPQRMWKVTQHPAEHAVEGTPS